MPFNQVTDGKFECLAAVSQNNSEVPVADMGDTNQGSTPTYAGDNGDASSDMVEVGSPERLNHDSDDSDDELFVSQSPKIPRGAVIIDLTDEPEAVSAARAEAMKGVVYLTGDAPIKEEEDEERILPVAFKDDQGSPSSDGGDDHDSDSGRESEFELDTEGPLSDESSLPSNSDAILGIRTRRNPNRPTNDCKCRRMKSCARCSTSTAAWKKRETVGL